MARKDYRRLPDYLRNHYYQEAFNNIKTLETYDWVELENFHKKALFENHPNLAKQFKDEWKIKIKNQWISKTFKTKQAALKYAKSYMRKY